MQCELHGLVAEYLQQTLEQDLEHSLKIHHENLNKELIKCCLSFSNGAWHIFDDDGYFYQNIVDHAIASKMPEVVNSIVTNLVWLHNKLVACKIPFSLIADLRKCYDYLKSQTVVSQV